MTRHVLLALLCGRLPPAVRPEFAMPILYLTEAEVARVLTMELALETTAAAFRKMALEEAENLPRQRVRTDQILLHVLPAAAKTLGAIGFKAYTTSKAGAKFHVTLFDPKQGGI